jgi:septation ring formation regulator EzrA
MDRIEEIVGRIEEELRRLRSFLEREVAPQAERRTAELLREVSQKLSQAASKLESRVAARPPKS